MIETSREKKVLRYEDMINDFDVFISGLTDVLDLSEKTQQQIFLKSRPRTSEDIHAHKRSGKTGGYKEKITPETIEILNEKFSDVIEQYGYGDN